MNFLTKDELQKTLGSFWDQQFSDKSFVDGWFKGLGLESRQLAQNTQELRDITSVEKVPEVHTELWSPVKLVQDRTTGSFYPLKYSPDSAVYGENGRPPVHDQTFVYGGYTAHRGLKPAKTFDDVFFLTDSIHNPSFILVRGTDFVYEYGTFVFLNDIYKNEAAKATIRTDLYRDQDVYQLWGYSCTVDMLYAAEQWGRVLGFESKSSPRYNKALWSLWRARRFGMTQDVMNELLSIYLNCPRVGITGEVVESVLREESRWVVITDQSVYILDPDDEPAVKVGDVLEAGTFVGKRVSVLESVKEDNIRESQQVRSFRKRDEFADVEDSVKANYITITCVETPPTLTRVNPDNPNTIPAYIKYNTGYGEQSAWIKQLWRNDTNRFTVHIETEVLPGDQIQVGEFQLYYRDGTPVIVEPYTGSISPWQASFNFITEEDDLLKLREDAQVDEVQTVYRVAVINPYQDREFDEMRRVLDHVRFSDNSAIALKEFLGLDVYAQELGVGDAVLTQNRLLDFDAIVLNTASGVSSKLEDGELADVPKAANDVAIGILTDKIDKQIESLKKEVVKLDTDLLWMLNYTNNGRTEADPEWLYLTCGVVSVPDYDTPAGANFFTHGAFSKLDPEKVAFYEENNRKEGPKFQIPEKPWPSSTGLGVSDAFVSTPVFSKTVGISSKTPKPVYSSNEGGVYTYKITGLLKHVD